MKCGYAGCGKPALMSDDGYDFCLPHFHEHRADFYGEPWPRLEYYSDLREEAALPCGTSAAYRRHFREGSTPCGPCRDADGARRRTPYARVRRRSA